MGRRSMSLIRCAIKNSSEMFLKDRLGIEQELADNLSRDFTKVCLQELLNLMKASDRDGYTVGNKEGASK